MKRIKGHDDAEADKKLFGNMIKKAMPVKKVKADVKGIKKAMHRSMKSCGK